MLGSGKKRSMMELQNLQEALKVEIQIHQVSPQPSPHTIWMECVTVETAVPSSSSRGHCIGMCFALMRMLKLSLSLFLAETREPDEARSTGASPSLNISVTVWSIRSHFAAAGLVYQGGVCVFFVQNADLKLQLRDLQAKITSLSERQVRAALWENPCCRISVLYELHVCLDQFNYLGSESPCVSQENKANLLGYGTCVASWHCFVSYCAEHLWCDLCALVLCCQMNNLPTHTQTHKSILPPFIWHFNNWWLMSGDDYVAYCPSLELTVQNPKFCGGDGEKMRCRLQAAERNFKGVI